MAINIDTALKGNSLLNDVATTAVPPGQCGLWWLGQHSFILKLGKRILFMDPYLSPHPDRQVPPLVQPSEVRGDLIFGTHDHLDHIDRQVWPVIAAADPAIRFVVPELLREKLASELNIPAARMLGLDDGMSLRTADLTIHGVASAHEFLDRDPASGRYPYLGFVVEGNGCRVYHAGDSCNYEGLQSRLLALHPDIMLLPINGRDAVRLRVGCIGNMTYQEAADLAGAVGPRWVIPAHYDMFASNAEKVELFIDYMRVKHQKVRTMVCPYGRAVIL